MIRARARTNTAAALRAIAKWLWSAAERIEPIKISRPGAALLRSNQQSQGKQTVRCVAHNHVTAGSIPAPASQLAQHAIEKARG